MESDLDALCDGEEVYIGGILEHIEDGRHPLRRLGDCCMPPFTL